MSVPADARSRSADFASVRALAAPDMDAIDALIRERLSSDVVLINQVAEHIIGGGGKRLRPMLHAAGRPCLRLRGRRARQAGGGDRVHPHRHPAARRRGRRVRSAPRPQDRQRPVGQRRQRAGRRLPVFARVPDDGRLDDMRVHAHPRRRHQHHRRGRGACSCSTCHDPDIDRGRLHERHRTQDRASCSRPPRRAGRRARRCRMPTRCASLRRYGMQLGYRLPARRRRARLRRRCRHHSARTSATTWPRASRPCR